jgi:hypothetical protein
MPNDLAVKHILTKARIVDLSNSEIKPMFVASSQIEKIVVGISKKTWANWRSMGKGPRFYIYQGRVYYRLSDIEEAIGQHPVETFSNN